MDSVPNCGVTRRLDGSSEMAKRAMDREYVWLQCTESGDLNYRTNIRVKGGIDEKIKAGLQKYSPRLRKHTLHKIKRK
jgi:large subunit ribosomal protein L33